MEEPAKSLFDLKRLIELRRHIHKNPEGSFKEFQTSKTIREYLTSLGIPENEIHTKALTGLQIDIRGKANGIHEGDQIVAFRADIDALEMKENNPSLEYVSVNNCAHMCGHDGHITCLIGGLSILLENLDQIPSNRVARFLFQPAEEKYGGAKRMVHEGCMEHVREVWGLHNVPLDPVGAILVKEGTLTSDVTFLKITVKGRGGHSSLKEVLLDPTLPACALILEIEKLLTTEFEEHNNRKLIFSLPSFKGSVTFNVFPDVVELEGTCRIFDSEVRDKFFSRLDETVRLVAEQYKIEIFMETPYRYPMIVNDKNLVDDFKTVFETSSNNLPMKFSEDFSEFSNVVPGCFFLLCVGKQAGKSLHADNYNFNDDVIEEASKNWFKIMRHRLNK